MRWRWSWWDAAVALTLGAVTWAAVRVMGAAPGPVPRHWGWDGRPDAFAQPSLEAALVLPGIALAMYLSMRVIDNLIAARTPERGGFMTDVAGITALLLALVHGLSLWAAVVPDMRLPLIPAILGGFFAALGGAFLRHRKIPWNYSLMGAVLDGAQEDRWRRGMGWSLVAVGTLVVALGLLPGNWSLLALLTMIMGPLGALIYLLATQPPRR